MSDTKFLRNSYRNSGPGVHMSFKKWVRAVANTESASAEKLILAARVWLERKGLRR